MDKLSQEIRATQSRIDAEKGATAAAGGMPRWERKTSENERYGDLDPKRAKLKALQGAKFQERLAEYGDRNMFYDWEFQRQRHNPEVHYAGGYPKRAVRDKAVEEEFDRTDAYRATVSIIAPWS